MHYALSLSAGLGEDRLHADDGRRTAHAGGLEELCTIRPLFIALAALGFLALGALALFALLRPSAKAQTPFDWRSDWAVPEGFALEPDSEGFQYPSAIAMIPNPGPGPQDPAYFVTELYGAVKVVTNDRTVHTFARDFFTLNPVADLSAPAGELGMAGICLEPTRGYVFVTYAYQDNDGLLRNNVVRFQSRPQTFSLEPESHVVLTEVFAQFEAAPSHQIGGCRVSNDLLYVSVADGRQFQQSRRTDSVLGKVLRMTLEGQPVESNPFYQDADPLKAVNYVWAYGFRNPFGLLVLGERVFVADNGSRIDRFIEAHAGEDYLWDGDDVSIGTRANTVISPAVGPVQLERYPEQSAMFPEPYRDRFYLALSAPQSEGVLLLPYNLDERRMLDRPQYFLRYRGEGKQPVVGVAFARDSLYVVPILPNAEGRSLVLRVRYAPEQAHPFNLENIEQPSILLRAEGCLGCHSFQGTGGQDAPILDREDLVADILARLESDEYRQQVQAVNQLDREPFTSFAEERQQVLEADGTDKVKTWMANRIVEPRFDNPYAQMPTLGLSKSEATAIADYLIATSGEEAGWLPWIRERIFPPRPEQRHLYYYFIVGLVVGAGLVGLWWIGTRARLARRVRR
jgi:hypothetical protein